MWSQIRAASSGCERPAKTISRFCGPRSIQWPAAGCGTGSLTSRPGRRVSSVVALSICVAFLVDLTGTCDGEGARRDILGDDRARRNPSIVANLDRSNERILNPGPDVPADLRTPLGHSRLVREVNRDVGGGHIRVLADLGVAEVREVRHLRPSADVGLLQLDERANLGGLVDDRPGPEVGERADADARADLRVDRDHVRADLGPGR